MKKLIVILCILSFIANAQKDTTSRFRYVTFNSAHVWVWKMDTLASCYKLWSDSYNIDCNGKITIKDTMTAIRSMVKWIEFKDSVIRKRENTISDYQSATDASKDFMNNLPDVFKDDSGNCKWSKFKKTMKKLGYTFSYNKYPKPICTK